MKALSEQIEKLRREILELEDTLPDWKDRAQSLDGSRKVRSISRAHCFVPLNTWRNW